MRKRTKIITTLGPASSSPKIIKNLIEEGTDVFRINLSHSNIEEIRKNPNLVCILINIPSGGSKERDTGMYFLLPEPQKSGV